MNGSFSCHSFCSVLCYVQSFPRVPRLLVAKGSKIIVDKLPVYLCYERFSGVKLKVKSTQTLGVGGVFDVSLLLLL